MPNDSEIVIFEMKAVYRCDHLKATIHDEMPSKKVYGDAYDLLLCRDCYMVWTAHPDRVTLVFDLVGRVHVAPPEREAFEVSRPEASRPEASRPEASRPEASRPEASRPEASIDWLIPDEAFPNEAQDSEAHRLISNRVKR